MLRTEPFAPVPLFILFFFPTSPRTRAQHNDTSRLLPQGRSMATSETHPLCSLAQPRRPPKPIPLGHARFLGPSNILVPLCLKAPPFPDPFFSSVLPSAFASRPSHISVSSIFPHWYYCIALCTFFRVGGVCLGACKPPPPPGPLRPDSRWFPWCVHILF